MKYIKAKFVKFFNACALFLRKRSSHAEDFTVTVMRDFAEHALEKAAREEQMRVLLEERKLQEEYENAVRSVKHSAQLNRGFAELTYYCDRTALFVAKKLEQTNRLKVSLLQDQTGRYGNEYKLLVTW